MMIVPGCIFANVNVEMVGNFAGRIEAHEITADFHHPVEWAMKTTATHLHEYGLHEIGIQSTSRLVVAL